MTSNLIFLVTCSANTYDVNRVTHGLFLVLMSVIVYCMLLAWCSQLLTVFSFPRKSILLTLRPGTSINKWIIMRHLKCCFYTLSCYFFPFLNCTLWVVSCPPTYFGSLETYSEKSWKKNKPDPYILTAICSDNA